MQFSYSKRNLKAKELFLQRFFEILPGAASWGLLLSLPVAAFLQPVWAAMGVIAFHLYWLLRLLYMTLFLVLSYIRLRVEANTDWLKKIQDVQKRDRQVPQAQEIIHLVIFPVVKETAEIYAQGIQSLLDQQIPASQILVLLAVEERSTAAIQKGAQELVRQHQGKFLDFKMILHPDGLPGEARVKGANVTFAAQEGARMLESRGIPFEKVIVSCLDADTILSPHYLSCLTYHFMVCPQRERASFQPIPVYHNNIWEVPGFARVLDVGSSFFQLAESTNPEKLVTFSSHSMSFKALVEIGYWPVDMISDDSAIFWKAFLFYEGDYRAIPMYVTVSMDVAASSTWRLTAMNVYKQKRRWAWGVENFPIVMRGFLQPSKISLIQKLKHGIKLFEGHLAWATWPFLITLLGWLPAFWVGRSFAGSVLSYSAPRITWTIFHLASVSLIISIGLSLLLLPKAPATRSFLKKIGHLTEWFWVPPISIFFSALPALDAQTRLMLGRHMEFWVTDKKRN